MQSYEERFVSVQERIKMHKLLLSYRRAMVNQARAKIKPSAMNPVLLNKPRLNGGDAYSTQLPLDLYYPANDVVGADEMDCAR